MPAQERSSDGQTDDAMLHLPSQQQHQKLPLCAGADNDIEGKEEEVVVKVEQSLSPSSPSLAPAVVKEEQRREHVGAAVDKEDSDFSHEDEEELPGYIYIDLQEIRKEVQCPICLGIIKKTRTVMECLHRFCRQCIDKSMRMGNKECPACRTHCASRRSLKDDPKYDAFIAAVFPDIEKYEKEELAFCGEEHTRNKQIQASIAQVSVMQEAVGKKRSSRKGTGVGSPSRSQRNNKYTPSRRSKRKRSGKIVFPEFDDNEDFENAEGQTSSYSGEHCSEIDKYRHKTRRRIGTSRPISPATSSDIENKLDKKRAHPGIMWNMEMRAWSKGGARSNVRHGSSNGLFRKNPPPSSHLAKLIEYFQKLEKMDGEQVASETPSGADQQLVAETVPPPGSPCRQGWLHTEHNGILSEVVDQFRDKLQMSEEKRPVADNCISHGGVKVILACQQKESIQS